MTAPSTALPTLREDLIRAMRADVRARAVVQGLPAEERHTREAVLGDGPVTAVQAGRVAQALAGGQVGPEVTRSLAALQRVAWEIALYEVDSYGQRHEQRWRTWAHTMAVDWHLPAEDLEVAAIEGAVQAALRWDPLRAPYGAYARHWVRKKIWEQVRLEIGHRGKPTTRRRYLHQGALP